jgi:membrane protein required for colicin V production
MNPLDMFIIVILGYCLIRGIFRGLVKEISSIIGVLAGFYAAYTYYPLLAKPLARWISNTPYLTILSFMIIFCVIFILISILGIIIKYLLNIAFLGWGDRICGAGFGIIKGILIVSVVLISLTAFLPKGAPIIKNSLLAPHVTLISEKMVKVVSKDMKLLYEAKAKEFKKTWKIP